MDLSRYAKHLRGAAIDLKRIVADNMRVMGPRIQGFARKAMPKRTGLLSRAMVTTTTADSLTLESAAISGPAYKGTGKRGTGGALVKYVADYAAERGTPQALQAMEWGQRQFVRLTRAAIRKRINSQDKPEGPANG